MRSPQPPSSKPPRILIVDDIPQNVDLVSSLMRAEGYEVASAANGLEALAQVASAPPDLILLDIMMPTLDGYAVCRQLKARPETRLVPIVLITALGDEAVVVQAVQRGAQDYLVKGQVESRLLTRATRYAMERKRAEETLQAGQESYRSLVENSPICIHEIDCAGRVISMNPAGLKMMGATDEGQVRGMAYLDLGLSVSHIFNGSVLSCSSASTPPAPSLPNWLWRSRSGR